MKFSLIFLAFTVLILAWMAFSVYGQQKNFFEKKTEEDARRVSAYLSEEIERDGELFLQHMAYMRDHRDEIVIPVDFTECGPARNDFEKAFQAAFPGKVFGVDVSFEQLPDQLKKSLCTYLQEYWLLLFERVRDSFHMSCCCYMVPTGDGDYVEYVIDAERRAEETADGGKKLHLLALREESRESIPVMWATWDSGEPQSGHDVFSNEYGNTYGYYLPLRVNDRTRGVICVDVDLTEMHAAVRNNTLTLGGLIAGGMMILMLLLIWLLNRQYVFRVLGLQKLVREYAGDKDPSVAEKMRASVRGTDELAALTNQVADMVTEMDQHMKRLVSADHELSSARKQVDEMNELAMNDALTGVKNRTAYGKTVERLDADIRDGIARFAIIMIDMNDLKKINDEYGHEQGNAALFRLSRIIGDHFKHSPVYRIGGDEFVVVAENRDLDRMESLMEAFGRDLDNLKTAEGLEPWERVSAAIGAARFDRKTDTETETVFRRADEAMYHDKQKKKAGRVR